MIPGIVAAQMLGRAGAGDGAPDYSAALLALDFERGIYQAGGATQDLADALDKPDFVASGSLQLRYVGSVANDDLVFITGDALAAIAGNPQGTFVFDWTEISAPDLFQGAFPFILQDAAFNSAFYWQRNDGGGGIPNELFISDLSPTGERDINNYLAASVTLGRHRLAITRDDSGLRASLDGLAVVRSDPDEAMTDLDVTMAIFGGALGDNLHAQQDINSLVVWPPVDDGDLPGLSALT